MEKGPKLRLKSEIKGLVLIPDEVSKEAIAEVAIAMAQSHDELPPEEAENRAVVILLFPTSITGDEILDIFTTSEQPTLT